MPLLVVAGLIVTIGSILAHGVTHTMAGTPQQEAIIAADGVYTDEQGARGQSLSDNLCATCHGDKLARTADGPPLKGQDFLSAWKDRTAADLNQKIQTTMPADAAGSLTAIQVTDLIAYLLKLNNFPAGP